MVKHTIMRDEEKIAWQRKERKDRCATEHKTRNDRDKLPMMLFRKTDRTLMKCRAGDFEPAMARNSAETRILGQNEL
jgi:hypothetical protein